MRQVKIYEKFEKTHFYIDVQCENAIINNIWTIKNKSKKEIIKMFYDAIDRRIMKIDAGNVTKQEYRTEYVTNKICIFSITALKFLDKKFTNARIYCQDHQHTKSGIRTIILCELLLSKKQDKLTQKELNIIERVKNYEY